MPSGLDHIVACPNCKSFARYGAATPESWVGPSVWTDGRQIGPMFPQPRVVARCRQCSEVYWLAEAEDIGALGPREGGGAEVDPAWADTGPIVEPTEEEYYGAIKKGLASDAEQERNLRILAWWKRNDALREGPGPEGETDTSASGPWRDNLEALERLLNHGDDNDRLIRAEVFRELGEFESAEEVLSQVESAQLVPVVRYFQSLCEARDSSVRELTFGP